LLATAAFTQYTNNESLTRTKIIDLRMCNMDFNK
jgi:hypothetical protein